jgi:hypothetical protein
MSHVSWGASHADLPAKSAVYGDSVERLAAVLIKSAGQWVESLVQRTALSVLRQQPSLDRNFVGPIRQIRRSESRIGQRVVAAASMANYLRGC